MNIAYICCFIREEIVSREINILYEKMVITLYFPINSFVVKEECLNLIDSSRLIIRSMQMKFIKLAAYTKTL